MHADRVHDCSAVPGPSFVFVSPLEPFPAAFERGGESLFLVEQLKGSKPLDWIFLHILKT